MYLFININDLITNYTILLLFNSPKEKLFTHGGAPVSVSLTDDHLTRAQRRVAVLANVRYDACCGGLRWTNTPRLRGSVGGCATSECSAVDNTSVRTRLTTMNGREIRPSGRRQLAGRSADRYHRPAT